MSGAVYIASGSETSLLSAVANVGPVAVAVDGNSNAFRVGHKRTKRMPTQQPVGIDAACSLTRCSLNHMLVQKLMEMHHC